jgi:hypothetical protein
MIGLGALGGLPRNPAGPELMEDAYVVLALGARALAAGSWAGRTGVDAGLLERVLGEEARGPRRRRVWLDTATGEYRLVRGRFDPDVLEALALLEP